MTRLRRARGARGRRAPAGHGCRAHLDALPDPEPGRAGREDRRGCPASRTPRSSSPTPAPRPTRPRCCWPPRAPQVQPGAGAAQQLPRPVVRRDRRSPATGPGRPRSWPRSTCTTCTTATGTCAAFRRADDAEYIAACVADLRDVLATTTAGDVACLIAEPIQGVGGFTMPPDGLFAALQGGPRRVRHPVHLRRGADRLGPHRRALLGHRGARRDAGHAHLRQGPGQRLRDRRRGRPRRPDGRAARQLASPRSAATRSSTAGAPRQPATTCSTTTCRRNAAGRRHDDHRRAARGRRRACRWSARCAARA